MTIDYYFDTGGFSIYPEDLERARKGEISRYIVFGVDVYRTKECAKEDKVTVDETKTFREQNGGGLHFVTGERKFFSSRFYQVVDLLDMERDMTASDLQEVRSYLPYDVKGIAILRREADVSDADTSFVYNPLTDEEQIRLNSLLQ